MRGGVSQAPELGRLANASSPRAWGCFYEDCEDFMDAAVFPTCVGVFLPRPARVSQRMCLPHVRGGVSIRLWNLRTNASSSPRAWGCFLRAFRVPVYSDVFPTCVGVFLRASESRLLRNGLPHVRGGVSVYLLAKSGAMPSSPRAWGCFCGTDLRLWHLSVFPTCVGVFL